MKPRNNPSIRSTRQILESAKRHHGQLSRHWEAARRHAGKPDAEMLLDYIRRKEEGFVDMVSRYLAHAPDEILDTYFQFFNSLRTRRTWLIASTSGSRKVVTR
jgi:hypothetical protein